MQFQLTQAEIHKAFKAYIKQHYNLESDFEFTIKTSRKGDKSSKAIINTLEGVKTQFDYSQVVHVSPIEEDDQQEEDIEEEEQEKPLSFKRLFK